MAGRGCALPASTRLMPHSMLVWTHTALLTVLIAAGGSGAEDASLHRFAVKGMSPDTLQRVSLAAGDAFPHDRQWALLKEEKSEKFNEQNPEWLHKENFECAFTAGDALAALDCSFDDSSYTLSVRQQEKPSGGSAGSPSMTANLRKEEDVASLETFLRQRVFGGRGVKLVSAGSGDKPRHQFGNTQSGVRRNGDSRTIHIINTETVTQVSEAIGMSLDPMRFRANIILDGLPAWEEFDWVDNGQITMGSASLSVISKTVRCDGVNIDLIAGKKDCDLPVLLAKHFPQYGPYLGVYAQVLSSGDIEVGDRVWHKSM